MKKLTLLAIVLLMSYTTYSSEALRYAKHGCFKNKSKIACEIVDALTVKKVQASKAQNTNHRSVASSSNDSTVSGIVKTPTGNIEIGFSKKNIEKIKEACKGFGDNVKSCSAFSCSFMHPMIPQKVTKKIIGFIGDKCKTEEEMPNNGLMTCLFSKDKLQLVAEFADSQGEKHSDKMTGWMNDGTCDISGY